MLKRVRMTRTLFYCPVYGADAVVLWIHKEQEVSIMAVLVMLAVVFIFPLMVIGEITKKYK